MCQTENLRIYDVPNKAYKMFYSDEKKDKLYSIVYYVPFFVNKWNKSPDSKSVANLNYGRIQVIDKKCDINDLISSDWGFDEIWECEIRVNDFGIVGNQLLNYHKSCVSYLVDEIKPIKCVFKR